MAHDGWQTYEFEGGNIHVLSSKPMQGHVARLFTRLAYISTTAGQLNPSISTIVSRAQTKDDIPNGVGASFTSITLNSSFPLLEGLPPANMSRSTFSQVTRIPRAPLRVLLLLDILYASLGILLMISAVNAVEIGKRVRHAQARLSTPALVAESFESPALGDDAKSMDDLFAERRGLPTRRVALGCDGNGGRRYRLVVTKEGTEKAGHV